MTMIERNCRPKSTLVPVSPGIPMVDVFSLRQSEIGGQGAGALLPCGELLEQISRALVALLTDGLRNTGIVVRSDTILLEPDRRRAVVLIASELVINALKYAFCNASAGSILNATMA